MDDEYYEDQSGNEAIQIADYKRDRHGNLICAECSGRGYIKGWGTSDTNEPYETREMCDICDGRGYWVNKEDE